MTDGDNVMVGDLPAVVKCSALDGDGNIVVALKRSRSAFYYSVVKPSSVSTPTEVTIGGIVYVADLEAQTIRPKEATR